MNRKYKTPEHAPAARPLRARTPNLNFSTLPPTGSSAGLRRYGSASKLDSTFAGMHSRITARGVTPKIKLSVTNTAPATDWDLECDFATNEYLRALAKQLIIEETTAKYKQDMKDQLAVQNVKTHKMQEILLNTKQQITCMEGCKTIEKLLNFAIQTLSDLTTTVYTCDLENKLTELRLILENTCNSVIVKNIDGLQSQEGYNQLFDAIDKCTTSMGHIKQGSIDVAKINEVAELIKQFKEILSSVEKKQQGLQEQQEAFTFDLLKSCSDAYSRVHVTASL